MTLTSRDWNSHPLEALDSLRAEREAHWLHEVFVEPPEFERMAGMRSCVVFGHTGSGKSALGSALARRALGSESAPTFLVVQWRPSLAAAQEVGSRAVLTCLAQALDACALALFRLIGQQPERFRAAPLWVQETLRWFVHQYLSGDREVRLSRLEEDILPAGTDLLRDIIAYAPREVLHPGAPEPQIIAELANAIHRIGLAGVWVIVDGLEPSLEADAETLAQTFKALFSTLALFEEPGFVMKVMAPAEIRTALMSSGGIVRRRMDVYDLHWRDDRLTTIIERRLALMTQNHVTQFGDLCESPELASWLKRYGGQLPRGWLDLARPFAERYLESRMAKPLTSQECEALQRSHPPKLRVDLTNNRVLIGYGEIQGIQPGGYKLLQYLYQERPRACMRSELYYRVYKGLTYEPQSHTDKNWDPPNEWGGIIDTLIWRLRQKIEPNPKTPLYLVTDRGKGVRLNNLW